LKKILVMIALSLFGVGCSVQNVSKEEQIPVIGKNMVNKTEYEMRVGHYKMKLLKGLIIWYWKRTVRLKLLLRMTRI
jgi:hypothetical protein